MTKKVSKPFISIDRKSIALLAILFFAVIAGAKTDIGDNIVTTWVNATFFKGDGGNITNINAKNISSGSLNNIPINLSGEYLNFSDEGVPGNPYMQYRTNVIGQYQGTLADGVQIGIGNKTWGWLLDMKKPVGNHVGNWTQLYFSEPQTTGGNYWLSPILFNSDSRRGGTPGYYHGLSMNITDKSASGDLLVSGIEINIDSPSDRGGDSSGIYVMQTGGGNAVSFYRNDVSGVGTGHTMEISKLAGGGNVIYSFVNGSTGYGYRMEINTSTTARMDGYTVYPVADLNLSRYGYSVLDAAETTYKYYVTLDGIVYANGLAIGGYGTTQDNKVISSAGNEFRFATSGGNAADLKAKSIVSSTDLTATTSTGNISVTGTSNTKSCITMYSPDGTAYKLQIANGGTTSVTAGTC